MGVSVMQAYGASWKDLWGMPKLWVIMILLLGGPVLISVVLGLAGILGIGLIAGFITTLIAIRVALNIVDRASSATADIVPPVMTYLKLIAAVIITGLPFALIGILTALVPFLALPMTVVLVPMGICIMMLMTVYNYVLAETGCGIIEGFERSARLVLRQPWLVAKFLVASMLINIAGLLVLILGLAVTMPLTVVAGARVYRALQAGDAAVPAPVEAIIQ